MSIAENLDRKLKQTARDDAPNYEQDAILVSRVLYRHFGDEALAFVDRIKAYLPTTLKEKR